jgi:hypothetical protein
LKRSTSPLVLAFWVLATGCGSCSDLPRLEAEGCDPDAPRDERLIALNDALRCREGGVVQDLSAQAEALLAKTGTPDAVAKGRGCAIDIVAALVRAGEKSAPVLTTRLGDPDSPYLSSRDALEVLARHSDPIMKGLAREQLDRLGARKTK